MLGAKYCQITALPSHSIVSRVYFLFATLIAFLNISELCLISLSAFASWIGFLVFLIKLCAWILILWVQLAPYTML